MLAAAQLRISNRIDDESKNDRIADKTDKSHITRTWPFSAKKKVFKKVEQDQEEEAAKRKKKRNKFFLIGICHFVDERLSVPFV